MLDTKARELKGKAVGSGLKPCLWCSPRAWVPELPCRHSKTGGSRAFHKRETKSELSQSWYKADVRLCPTLDPRNIDSVVSVSVFWDPLPQRILQKSRSHLILKQEGKGLEEKNFPVNVFLCYPGYCAIRSQVSYQVVWGEVCLLIMLDHYEVLLFGVVLSISLQDLDSHAHYADEKAEAHKGCANQGPPTVHGRARILLPVS